MKFALAVVLLSLIALAGYAIAQPTNLAPFETNVTVGTTATMAAVAANPTRKGLMLCNSGPAGSTINVTFGTITPTATTGIVLAGGAVAASCLNLMPYMNTNVSMGAQINAIASAAGTPLVALEF